MRLVDGAGNSEDRSDDDDHCSWGDIKVMTSHF